MPKHSKLLLTALTAAFVLAGFIATASARRIEINEPHFRVVWTSLHFSESAGGGPEARCRVTLEGSFHSRTLSKVCGQLVGYITRAIKSNCTLAGGAEEVEILTTTLPWHIQYQSFSGTLPLIEKIRLSLINTSFNIRAFVIANCLYRSTQTSPAFGEVNINTENLLVTGLTADPTKLIPKNSGPESCPGSGRFEGTGSVTKQGETGLLKVALVQ